MARRKGWTQDDLNWSAWKMENFAAMFGATVVFVGINVTVLASLFTLTGTIGEWGWMWSLIPLGALVAASVILGGYPDTIVRMYLRITAGPRKDVS